MSPPPGTSAATGPDGRVLRPGSGYLRNNGPYTGPFFANQPYRTNKYVSATPNRYLASPYVDRSGGAAAPIKAPAPPSDPTASQATPPDPTTSR